jgi:hypothetical protein
VRSYRTLNLADVYAVISRYLGNPAPFDNYLRQCEEEAAALRREIEAKQPSGVAKDELLARAREKGLISSSRCSLIRTSTSTSWTG